MGLLKSEYSYLLVGYLAIDLRFLLRNLMNVVKG